MYKRQVVLAGIMAAGAIGATIVAFTLAPTLMLPADTVRQMANRNQAHSATRS